MSRIIKNALNFSHELIKQCINEGDIVVDATAGNGYDTVFLAKQVGKSGKVYAFDIQKTAIESTTKRTRENLVAAEVIIIHDGHERMSAHIDESVKVILFNLGYLPGGSQDIITKPQHTLKAAQEGLQLLCPGGLMVFVVYHGHCGGKEEAEALLGFAESLDQKHYTVMMYQFLNQKNCPPFLMGIEKIK